MCLSTKILERIEANSLHVFLNRKTETQLSQPQEQRAIQLMSAYRNIALLGASQLAGTLTSSPEEIPRRYQMLLGLTNQGEEHIDELLTVHEATQLYGDEITAQLDELEERGLKLAKTPATDAYKSVLALCYQNKLLESLHIEQTKDGKVDITYQLPGYSFEEISIETDAVRFAIPDVVQSLIQTHDVPDHVQINSHLYAPINSLTKETQAEVNQGPSANKGAVDDSYEVAR